MKIQTNNIARNTVAEISAGSDPKCLSATKLSSGRTSMPTALTTTSILIASCRDSLTIKVASVLIKNKKR
jgi:hypothetical protein